MNDSLAQQYANCLTKTHENLYELGTEFVRKQALHQACVNGWLLTIQWILDQHPVMRSEDRDSLVRDACHNDHVDILEYLLDKYPDVTLHVIGDMIFEISSANASTRKFLLERYPESYTHIHKCYQSTDTLNAVRSPLMHFLIETTKNHDISYRRGIVSYYHDSTYTCIYIVSTQLLDVPDTLKHIDAVDFHVYFAPFYPGLFTRYPVDTDIQYIVDSLRLEKLHRARIFAKKSATK